MKDYARRRVFEPMTPLVNLDLAALPLAVGAFEPDGRPTDPYRAEASKMFGVPYDAVTRAQREYAKQAAYRAAYSASAAPQSETDNDIPF